MSRPALGVTALFYLLLGLSLIQVELRYSQVFLVNGILLVLAGLLTLAGFCCYHTFWVRLLAAMVRAGAMAALTIFSVSLFVLHMGGIFNVMVFGYLTVISALTGPPAPTFPHLRPALDAMEHGASPHEAVRHLDHTVEGE